MPQITFDGVHLGHKIFASVYENSLLFLFNLLLSLCLKDKIQGNFLEYDGFYFYYYYMPA